MIYTVTKNGYRRTLSIKLGDLKAKGKLDQYRRRGWQISAKERPDPVPETTLKVKVLSKKNEKKEESLIKILGYWVGD